MKNSREKGNIAEEIACKYLKQRNFFIQNRNYYKKWGEIDIIAVKDGILHFLEVKSVIDKKGDYLNHKSYRPEENVHNLKLRKLRRVIQSYLNDNKYGLDIEFKFHVIAIRFDQKNDKIFIKMLENIIL